MVDTPRAHEQQLPLQNLRVSVQDELIAEIKARRDVGIDTYGTALQPFNGRDPGRDLTEELLDAAIYAKQLAIENRDMKLVLGEILDRVANVQGEGIDRDGVRAIMERHGVVV